MCRAAENPWKPGEEPWAPEKEGPFLNKEETGQLRKIRAEKLRAEKAEEMLLLESWLRKLPPPWRN